MNKRSLSILLILMLCIGLFAGCQSSELKNYSDEETESPAVSETEGHSHDYGPVFASFAPETVMITVNGLDITWQELFYWYHYDVTSIESYYGHIEDWDAPCAFDESQTYREFLMDDALEITKYYRTLESKCIELGVSLSDDELAGLDASWQNNVDSYGGTEEDFLSYLEGTYMTKELFYYFTKIQAMYSALMTELYGADGEKLPAEDVIAKAEENSLVRAKHVLFKTVDDSNAPLSDDEIAAKLTAAEATLAELQGITDTEALEARIDELISEVSEDTGSLYYPDGYTFSYGEMTEAFETAVFEMEDNKLSGIVETNYGYHIIMRLPLKADAIVEYSGEGLPYTLAYTMSQSIFSGALDNWAADAVVVFSDEYKAMDIAELFAKAQ